jgi:uncharacterized protein
MQWVVVRDTPGGISVAETWLAGVGSWLAAAYVAAFVRGHDHPALRVPMAWLATAGRMPLTSYLTQSLVMGALLSGWGLALGDRLDHLGASLLALAIYAVQVVVARLVMRRWGQGPVEWLWRRWTYAGVALPVVVR